MERVGMITQRIDPQKPHSIIYGVSTEHGEAFTLEMRLAEGGGFLFALTHHDADDHKLIMGLGDDLLLLIELLQDPRVTTTARTFQNRP